MEGNTKFAFGIDDVSTLNTAGLSVTIDISITSPNYPGGTVVVYVPVTIN